jgi:hypothetical protein
MCVYSGGRGGGGVPSGGAGFFIMLKIAYVSQSYEMLVLSSLPGEYMRYMLSHKESHTDRSRGMIAYAFQHHADLKLEDRWQMMGPPSSWQ